MGIFSYLIQRLGSKKAIITGGSVAAFLTTAQDLLRDPAIPLQAKMAMVIALVSGATIAVVAYVISQSISDASVAKANVGRPIVQQVPPAVAPIAPPVK
jgi:hypothetical protein